MSSPGLIPTFSTAVNTWQCDENNHLNVQFYSEFAHQASAHLLASLGLGPRAGRAAGLNLGVAEDHVRYLREFRVVDPVEVLSAPVELGERQLVAYHEIRNASNGEVAATVRRRLVWSKLAARWWHPPNATSGASSCPTINADERTCRLYRQGADLYPFPVRGGDRRAGCRLGSACHHTPSDLAMPR